MRASSDSIVYDWRLVIRTEERIAVSLFSFSILRAHVARDAKFILVGYRSVFVEKCFFYERWAKYFISCATPTL